MLLMLSEKLMRVAVRMAVKMLRPADKLSRGTVVVMHCVVALAFLVVEVSGCQNFMRLPQTQLTTNVTGGDITCYNESAANLKSIRIKFKMVHQYSAMDWNLSSNFKQFCLGGGCPKRRECANLAKSGPNPPVLSRFYCKFFQNSCVLGKGCWIGLAEVKAGSPVEVYHLERSTAEAEFRNGKVNCVNNGRKTLPQWNTVIKKSDGHMICPGIQEEKKHGPRYLGELRVINGKMNFSWDSVQCSMNKGWDGVCVKLRSDEECRKLPTVLDGYNFTVHSGHVVVKPISRTFIMMECRAATGKNESQVTILDPPKARSRVRCILGSQGATFNIRQSSSNCTFNCREGMCFFDKNGPDVKVKGGIYYVSRAIKTPTSAWHGYVVLFAAEILPRIMVFTVTVAVLTLMVSMYLY